MSPVITLLTDFGLRDAYVGAMKGVILGINPKARIVDLTHEIEPQNVKQAAYLLKTAYHYFPAGSVHVAVVDPGVGTERRPIAARLGQWTFVAPDNGLLTYAIQREDGPRVVEIVNPRYMLPGVSGTFHGRDIFAPAAARLSLGAPLSDLGPEVPDPVLLPPPPQPAGDVYPGSVIHVDRFGNCITDIEEAPFRRWATQAVTMEAGGRTIRGLAAAYGEAAPGEAVALFGSSGHLEMAVTMGSAQLVLGLHIGSAVLLRRGQG